MPIYVGNKKITLDKVYVDGSLAERDASITYLFDWNIEQDTSISELDASVIWLFENPATGDVTKAYVDGSLAERDASIEYLFGWNIEQDASIERIDASLNDVEDISDGLFIKLIAVENGSAAQPSLTFQDDLSTGLFLQGTDKIGVATGGAENFRFDVSTFHAVGAVIEFSATPSDIRLKEDLQILKDPLNKILALDGVNYRKKGTQERHIGYIAQEVEPIIPEVILETNILGQPDDILYKTIRYSELIPYLSEAIKEQHKIISELREEIEDIKKELRGY